MLLKGSCHCGGVQFQAHSKHPYPFNFCYCSICRKTAGGGGYAINIGADHATLKVDGEAHLAFYQAKMPDKKGGDTARSPAKRFFCMACGSHLWLWDPRWPELVHPLASAIDTQLPAASERTHLMLGSKAAWVEPDIRPGDQTFDGYPEESIEAWHKRLGLER